MTSGLSRAIRCGGMPPAEKGQRTLDRILIGLAEIAKRRKRLLGILPLAQHECIEPAACEKEELVAEYIANRPQLPLPAVAGAQQMRYGIAAAVAELREVHRHYAEMPKNVGYGGQLLDNVNTIPLPPPALYHSV